MRSKKNREVLSRCKIHGTFGLDGLGLQLLQERCDIGSRQGRKGETFTIDRDILCQFPGPGLATKTGGPCQDPVRWFCGQEEPADLILWRGGRPIDHRNRQPIEDAAGRYRMLCVQYQTSEPKKRHIPEPDHPAGRERDQGVLDYVLPGQGMDRCLEEKDRYQI